MSINRIQSMDVLRSVAILTVVLAHSVLAYGAPSSLAPLQFGGSGVSLFFVLSGWLLGCQLFKELSTSGSVNVRRFWYRRWMRTLPAYLVVLVLSVLQRYLTKDNVEFPWQYFIFVQNYFYPLQFFTVSWSLAVEEQFYLGVGILFFFIRFLSRNHRTYLLLFILFLPYFFRQINLFSNEHETHVIFDGCILGVLLANLKYDQRDIWNLLINNSKTLFAVSLLCYFSFYYFRYNPDLGISDPDQLFLVLIFGCWIIFANSGHSHSSFLFFPGAYYIATRSYSIYLLHPEVLALSKRFFSEIHFILYFSLVFLITVIFSELLYRFIEIPFLKFRDRNS